MLSSEFLSFATTAGERIVLPKINQKSLNIIPVPVPSLKEQEEIVKRVQILFDILDDVERRYNTLCEKLDKLPQTLLCKAFKGELL
jgi:type I restriction enzyme S subunit